MTSRIKTNVFSSIFAHQVIVRHRSPVLAEKIRQEERKAGGKKRAITILLPDLDFNVALVLLEFMYTDDVFTRLLPGEDLVREVFIVHVGGTRCVTSNTDNTVKIHVGITLNDEFIRTCILIFLCYVEIQGRV
tara:strand:- start:9 stop:407 length:399 start_codon:yes stop_codon:yes gene_type:complete